MNFQMIVLTVAIIIQNLAQAISSALYSNRKNRLIQQDFPMLCGESAAHLREFWRRTRAFVRRPEGAF